MDEQLDIFNSGMESFKFTKPIKVIELFAGYGSQMLAFEYLKVNAEHFKICEWAVPSILAYNLIHVRDFTDYSKEKEKEWLVDYLTERQISVDYNKPMTKEQIARKGEKWIRNVYNNIIATNDTVDVTKTHGNDFYLEDRNKYNVFMSYSFPCLTKDSLILTKDGYKEYKDLKVGEYVLTKSNTWQKIVKKFDNGIHKTYILNGMGFENICCTSNHKFYVREKTNKVFSEPIFKEVKNITKKDYFGIPVNTEEIPFYTNDKDFWYMIGYYLGDGWLSKRHYDVKLAANDKKLEKLLSHLKNFKYTINKEKTCYKVRFADKDAYMFIEKYLGSGANTKKVCGEILRMPKDLLASLLQGYLDSDGCIIGKNYQFSSINRALIYSISFIANKVYHCPTKIYKIKVKPPKLLCGREVNQSDWYMLRYKIDICKQDRAFYENGYIWYPFTSIKESVEEHVYNMEIENDHSYIVQGCISKNCQDLSLAGYGKGMEEGSGTRSSMLWEVGRILKEMKELNQLPDVLMMENVPQVCGSKNKSAFDKWLNVLESLGYASYYKILSATDFGIPQTRKRCFVISILGNESYQFPVGWKLDKCLKDMLEDEVDEKYFLSEKQMQNITLWNNTPNRMEKTEKEVAKTLTTFAGRNDYNCNYVKIEKVGETKNKAKFQTRTDVIGKNGSVPTLSATDYKHPILLGSYTPSGRSGKIYDIKSVSSTITTGNHGNVNAVGLPIKEAIDDVMETTKDEKGSD